MSDDPETLRQIEELSHDDRPLLVLDVDDVLLDFIKPFPTFLERQGYKLTLNEFRLLGNIARSPSGELANASEVQSLIDGFFVAQAEWQSITDGAADALAHFGDRVEIVLLTHMPHRHREARRKHLLDLGLTYPVLTTEMPKGPAIRRLRGDNGRQVAFVDDQPRNLASAIESVPDVHAIHLMADISIRHLQQPAPAQAHVVDDWAEATPKIARLLGI
ncbi:MAG: hypothetical protein WBA44_04805 [Mesorhizobium sp.]